MSYSCSVAIAKASSTVKISSFEHAVNANVEVFVSLPQVTVIVNVASLVSSTGLTVNLLFSVSKTYTSVSASSFNEYETVTVSSADAYKAISVSASIVTFL